MAYIEISSTNIFSCIPVALLLKPFPTQRNNGPVGSKADSSSPVEARWVGGRTHHAKSSVNSIDVVLPFCIRLSTPRGGSTVEITRNDIMSL